MFEGATIVFDLDGTLVDTAPDLTNALNDVLTRRGYAAASFELVRTCVGHGSRAMIETALRRMSAEEDVEQMLAEFLRHYEANIAAESRPYPGVVRLLERLAAQGATLAVCTNKREYLSRLLLKELGLDRYFAAVAGRDTFAVSKPNPLHLTQVIAQARGNPSRAIMIGDSEIDLKTANAAGVPIILVSFGYAAGPLDALQPDARVDHFDELESRAVQLLNGMSARP